MSLLKTLIRALAVLVLAYVSLVGVGRLLEREHGARIVAIAAVAMGLGLLVRALSRLAPHIRRSGRDASRIGDAAHYREDEHGGHFH